MLELSRLHLLVRLINNQTAIRVDQSGPNAIVAGLSVVVRNLTTGLKALHGDRSSGIDGVSNCIHIASVISSSHEGDPRLDNVVACKWRHADGLGDCECASVNCCNTSSLSIDSELASCRRTWKDWASVCFGLSCVLSCHWSSENCNDNWFH